METHVVPPLAVFRLPVIATATATAPASSYDEKQDSMIVRNDKRQ